MITNLNAQKCQQQHNQPDAVCRENNTKPPYLPNDYPPTQIQHLSLTTRQHITETAQQAVCGQQQHLCLSSGTYRWWGTGSGNNHLNRRKMTAAGMNGLTVHADINLMSTDNNSTPCNFWAIMACLICTEQEMAHLFIVVGRGLVTIIKDISICATSKLEFMIHTTTQADPPPQPCTMHHSYLLLHLNWQTWNRSI